MVILPEVLTFFGLSREFRNAGYFETEQAHRIALALQLYEARTISVQHICDRLGIARRTLYRYLVAHRAQPLKTS